MFAQHPGALLILLVEDDDNHIELISRSFEAAQEPYRLEVCCTIHDARVFLAHQMPQLVLADYRLPDGDGKELIHLMDGSCPVILMTSQGNEQVAVEAMKAGAQDYIVKSPETFYSMPRIVDRALREWDLIQKSKNMYEAVSRGKREWEQTFDAVPDMISIIDANHTIQRVNRAMANRCGCKPEELIGRACHEVMHGLTGPSPSCPHARMMCDGRNHQEEVEEKKLNGFFDVTVSPLYDNDGRITACVHVARDITERKKAENERHEMEQKFQQTQKLESLGVLAGGIAHDFNNILTIILGHCHIITNGIDSGADQTTHVRQIEKAAGRAADLCRQMLTYAGKSALVQTRINLWSLVDENVKMLRSAIKKNVGIELGLKSDLPVITGDSAQIQQVVMNLIINAAEAIDSRNGTVRIALQKVAIQADRSDRDFLGNVIQAGNYACLEVSDNGCGMDAETQKRIFEPFYTTKFSGRGLGMSAVLGIVKSHDGALQLSSTLGDGTTFKVYFPLSGASDVLAAGPAAGLAPLAKGSGSILLVDDEEALRIIGSALLKAMGFSVITASNGREALETYKEQARGIDLILLDKIMPEMGGIDTYRRLREISPTIPVVLCSGYAVEEFSENIDNDQYAAVIQKPYKPDELRNTLMELLDKAGRHT